MSLGAKHNRVPRPEGAKAVFVGVAGGRLHPSAAKRSEKAKNVKDVPQSVNWKQVAPRDGG